MFHVPEWNRIISGPMASDPAIPAGAFLLDSCEPGWRLYVIADDGRAPGMESGWEHISVRAARRDRLTCSRLPTWREMCLAKDTFWDGDDVVIQIHPAKANYINVHPHVLHLWRPIAEPLPLPPLDLI